MTNAEGLLAPIAWDAIAKPLFAAEDSLARLDERLTTSRLAKSPGDANSVIAGWIARSQFFDAAASLWLEGELVHIEDLVLHDAHMDIRAPTHELTRAHAVLRARRQIFKNTPDWALGHDGLRILRGRSATSAMPAGDRAGEKNAGREGEGALASEDTDEQGGPDDVPDDHLAQEFAAIDAVLKRSTAVLDGAMTGKESRPDVPAFDREDKNPLVYDADWDEEARLADWQSILGKIAELPPLLGAALLWDAWNTIEPLQHGHWLGHLLVAAHLRQAGKTTAHLACLNSGLRTIPREKRYAKNRTTRLMAFLDGIREAASLGLKDFDRLTLAGEQMRRRLRGRRGNSKLPQLVDLVLSRPLITSAMIEKDLKVSTRGALNLVAELDLREMTGRKRFQAWGIV